MEDYQQRVVDEKTELNEKQAALEVFKASSLFVGLPCIDRGLLKRQAEHMQEYSDILGQRIARF